MDDRIDKIMTIFFDNSRHIYPWGSNWNFTWQRVTKTGVL